MYSAADLPKEGLPHSDIRGSTIARISPRFFAACHVLHRLLAPRHPPDALLALKASAPPCTGTTNTNRHRSHRTHHRKHPNALILSHAPLTTATHQTTPKGTKPPRPHGAPHPAALQNPI